MYKTLLLILRVQRYEVFCIMLNLLTVFCNITNEFVYLRWYVFRKRYFHDANKWRFLMYVKSFSFKYASCSKLIFRYASRVSNPQQIHLTMYSRQYSAKYTKGLTSTHHQEKRPTEAKRTANINAKICVSICCIPCIFSWLMSFTVRLRTSFRTNMNGKTHIAK